MNTEQTSKNIFMYINQGIKSYLRKSKYEMINGKQFNSSKTTVIHIILNPIQDEKQKVRPLTSFSPVTSTSKNQPPKISEFRF